MKVSPVGEFEHDSEHHEDHCEERDRNRQRRYPRSARSLHIGPRAHAASDQSRVAHAPTVCSREPLPMTLAPCVEEGSTTDAPVPAAASQCGLRRLRPWVNHNSAFPVRPAPRSRGPLREPSHDQPPWPEFARGDGGRHRWPALGIAHRETTSFFTLQWHGGLEAAVVNLLSPGEQALFCVMGSFGERWQRSARPTARRSCASRFRRVSRSIPRTSSARSPSIPRSPRSSSRTTKRPPA